MNSASENPFLVKRRRQLLNSLRQKGIHDEAVLAAMNRAPRHLFLPPQMEDEAYQDKPLPIGEGQTISQPYTVAYQTTLLDVQPGMKVLEIGTGSGYQSAVLAEMDLTIYTIERQWILYERNSTFTYLKQYKNLHFCYGDGFDGWPDQAPFDRIMITAAPATVPYKLAGQLKENGYMVVPVGESENQFMLRVKKNGAGFTEEVFHRFHFVPMLPGRQ